MDFGSPPSSGALPLSCRARTVALIVCVSHLPCALHCVRGRVKAGYTPGGAPLCASSTAAGITTLKHAGGCMSMIGQSGEDMQYVLPLLSPALKSDERQECDTADVRI